MENQPRISSVIGTADSSESLSRRLGAFDLFTIGFGAIIGVGWIIVIGDWINLGGGPYATALAFLVGALLLLPIALVFGELTSAVPVAGGAIVYAQMAFGKRVSFLTGWFLTLSYIMMCPWEIIAIGQLTETLFPAMKVLPLYTVGEFKMCIRDRFFAGFFARVLFFAVGRPRFLFQNASV